MIRGTVQRGTQSGSTLLELLVASTIGIFLLLGVMKIYSQANMIKTHVEGSARVQDNLRLAMDRVSRDLRMIGFGVPTGLEIGNTRTWQPALFRAGADDIGFRGEVDGGYAEVTCTPDASSTKCPLSKVWLDSASYYQDLNCKRPDDPSAALQVIVVADGDTWSREQCNGWSTSG